MDQSRAGGGEKDCAGEMKMNGILKRMTGWLLAASLSISGCMTAFAKPEWPADTGIMAEGGIVVDEATGTVLFGQNIHKSFAPASITKLLTALVVVENSDLDDMVTFSQEAVYDVEAGSGNKLNLETGDQLSVRDCLYALLLESCNQAGNALAEHVGGSMEGFVDMMNAKVTELGGNPEETHFANPSGLNDENQYVSPYDMALIARAAFANETVLEIDSTKSYKLPATIHNPNGRTLNMEHKILVAEDPSSQFYCEGATAGKTGFTSIAGNTLVTYAVREGRGVIAVVLKGTQPQYYLDSKALLDFGFANFQNLGIPENETAYTTGEEPVTVGDAQYEPSDLYLEEGSQITIPKDAQFADADKTLETSLPEDHPAGAVARVSYTYNDRQVGGAWLYSKTAVQAAEAESQSQAEAQQPQETPAAASPQEQPAGTGLGLLVPILLGLAAVVAAAALILWLRERKREREALELRRERRRQRLKEYGCTEEEFERMRQERFGDKPGSRRQRRKE